ncbi:hypothetical protein BaRGS_00009087 [Batillaria attramentaria]|uniref:EF-hand domain-containing protein n=1 Tax=Batillaria attramentaria TaxID=370345 RepID=A0ABD0LKC3_9CAEN|nr:hypothetical protein BaRGS_033011 [Batillaria attramentaria]
MEQKATGPDPDKYKQLFEKFDADGNGYLSITEFRNLLKAADSSLRDSQIAEFFVFLDGPRGDRRLTFEEFTKGIEHILDYSAKAKALFKKYDTNGDGVLDRDELRRLLRDLSGGKMTDSEMDQILRDADKNGDNKIALDEFINACC